MSSVSDVAAFMRANPDAMWEGDLEGTRIDDPSSPFYLPGIAFVGVEKKKVVPTCTVKSDVTWNDVVDRDVDVSLDDIELAEADAFVPGGFSRGPALRHVTIEIDSAGKRYVCIGEGGVLGSRFDEFLREYDQDTLLVIVDSYWNGFDVERAFTADFRAEISRRESSRAEERAASSTGRHSDSRAKASWRKHSKMCQRNKYVLLLAATFAGLVQNGAVDVLGTVEDVMGTVDEPLSQCSVVIEPRKPRICLWSRELNEGTEERPVTLEGLPMLRDMAMATADGGYGMCLDEQSGY
eukprot:gene30328-26693_t